MFPWIFLIPLDIPSLACLTDSVGTETIKNPPQICKMDKVFEHKYL